MVDEVIYEIGKLKWTFVIDFAIVLFLCALLLLLTSKFSWNRKKARVFAFLYNLNERQAACVGLMLGRMCFLLTNIIRCKDIGWGQFVVFILISLFLLILNKNFTTFIYDLLNYTIMFFLLYIDMSLMSFYKIVDSNMLIVAMVVMLSVFIMLYSLQQFLSTYSNILDGSSKRRVKVND